MTSNVPATTGLEFLEATGKQFVIHLKETIKEKVKSDEVYLELASNRVTDRIIDEITLECVSNVHRAVKLGYSELLFAKIIEDNTESISTPQLPQDLKKDKKSENINCPICQKLMHGTKFAGHLHDCMTGGRTSSRIANQKIANNSKEGIYLGEDETSYLEDDFWKATRSKSTKRVDGKKKKENNRRTKPYKNESPKGSKENKVGNSLITNILTDESSSPSKSVKDDDSTTNSLIGKENGDSDLWISPNKVLPIVNEDQVQLLSIRCGVRSDHTGKFCSRSLRCHLHTDAERADVRKMFGSADMHNWDTVDELEINNNRNELGPFSSLISITASPPTTPRKKDKKKVNVGKSL